MKSFITRFTKKFFLLIFAATAVSVVFIACETAGERKSENSTAIQNETVAADKETAENKPSETKSPTETKKDDQTTVYDGREGITNASQKRGTAADEEMINGEFKRNETVVLQKSKLECDDKSPKGVEIVGTAKGAFTEPNSKQTAFLYERCRAGRSFGIGGIIIVENGKSVAHYVYGENGLSNGLLALPDVNKNGLSELVLVGGGTNQGYSVTSIDIIEATGEKTVFLGRTPAHSDNSGAAENEADVESTDYVITVEPSANPVFFQDIYIQKGSAGKPKLTKKGEKVSLEKNDPPAFIKIS